MKLISISDDKGSENNWFNPDKILLIHRNLNTKESKIYFTDTFSINLTIDDENWNDLIRQITDALEKQ